MAKYCVLGIERNFSFIFAAATYTTFNTFVVCIAVASSMKDNIKYVRNLILAHAKGTRAWHVGTMLTGSWLKLTP